MNWSEKESERQRQEEEFLLISDHGNFKSAELADRRKGRLEGFLWDAARYSTHGSNTEMGFFYGGVYDVEEDEELLHFRLVLGNAFVLLADELSERGIPANMWLLFHKPKDLVDYYEQLPDHLRNSLRDQAVRSMVLIKDYSLEMADGRWRDLLTEWTD